MNIKEVAEAAKREGMTYGQYVSAYSPSGPQKKTVREKTGICAFCGNPFLIPPGKHGKKYCTQACVKASFKARAAARKKGAAADEQKET